MGSGSRADCHRCLDQYPSRCGPFKAERLSDQTGSRRFGSHDRLWEPQCASAGGGSFIIRSISGPPVFRKRHTRRAAKPRNAMLSQVV